MRIGRLHIGWTVYYDKPKLKDCFSLLHTACDCWILTLFWWPCITWLSQDCARLRS
jgi:hypothetical protein